MGVCIQKYMGIPDDLEKLDDARIKSEIYEKTKSTKEDLRWA